ncbi:protein arginine N-methyltransferase 2-like [Glandiceps talaboti]
MSNTSDQVQYIFDHSTGTESDVCVSIFNELTLTGREITKHEIENRVSGGDVELELTKSERSHQECEQGNDCQDNYVDDEILENWVAFSDFSATEDNQLSFLKGEEIKVISKPNDDWWWAVINDKKGYIPANHVTDKSKVEWEAEMWQNEDYFDSYANVKIHYEMLSDDVRTNAYREAIVQNAEWLKDKVVLDIGCGTGILSLFAAKYGQPKQVYAVEASDFVNHTEKLIKQNGFADKITLLNGRIETVSLPEKVDIIISEWMGTMLLFELMIESVLLARDYWLKDTGVMWPSDASLYLVPCTAAHEYKKVKFWDNVYEFDFSYLKSFAQSEFFDKPIFNHELKSEDCLAVPQTVLDLNMNTVQIQDLEEIERDFCFEINQSGDFHGFGSWFTVKFNTMQSDSNSVVLDTGPFHRLTHWKQDLFMMEEPVEVAIGDKITGSVSIKRNPHWRRHLKIIFRYKILSNTTDNVKDYEKLFPLWR